MEYKKHLWVALLTTTLLMTDSGAHATCLSHKINFAQSSDQYRWSMTWTSAKPMETYVLAFSELAGAILSGRSEVVQDMWWKRTGTNAGSLDAWLRVMGGKKFYSRQCSSDALSLYCQLNTKVGDAGSHINWAWSKIVCSPKEGKNQCTYEEAGSVNGMGFLASAQKISVNLNTQSMKDTLRLAIAAESGVAAVNAGFATSRSTADAFWNEGQTKMRAKSFQIGVEKTCN